MKTIARASRRSIARCVAATAVCFFAVVPFEAAAADAPGAPALGPEDEAALRAIIASDNGSAGDNRIAGDLDWENAFGIRYRDKRKRETFFHTVVSPSQTAASEATLEIRTRAITPDVAIADEYWHIVGQLDRKTGIAGADRWGRTSYVFVKRGGAWTLQIERVADLRAAYFKHYDVLPSPAPLGGRALDALAGRYALPASGGRGTGLTLALKRDGDRFAVTSPIGRARVGIPISPTVVLIFDTGDLESYYRLSAGPGGPMLSNGAGDFSFKLTKS